MDERARRLVRLSALIVLGRWDELTAFRAAAPEGEPDRAWREAVLQSHLFAGFPRLVEAYEVLDAAGGLGAPSEDEGEEDAVEDRTARGAVLFETIYAANTGAVRARLAEFHPDAHRWIADHAYGRVLSRPGLAPDTRELCAVACLLVSGQDRQLASHARGAVRCGATPEDVASVVDLVGDLVPEDVLNRGAQVLTHFARPG